MENEEHNMANSSLRTPDETENSLRSESIEMPEAHLDVSPKPGQESAELLQKIVAAETRSQVLDAEIVDDLAEMTPVPREETRVNLAIASYFQEKGPEILFRIYGGMDNITKRTLKEAIARGNLEKVVELVEDRDPTVSQSARKMHPASQSDEEFVQTFDRATWLHLERIATLTKKHEDLARQWSETGTPPVSDTAEVRDKLAELPLDMRDFLEKIDPETRRTVISDQLLLETSVEHLYGAFPLLRKELANAHLRARHSPKESNAN